MCDNVLWWGEQLRSDSDKGGAVVVVQCLQKQQRIMQKHVCVQFVGCGTKLFSVLKMQQG